MTPLCIYASGKARATREGGLRGDRRYEVHRVHINALSSLVPNAYQGMGYWWHRDDELDIVGLGSDRTLVAGECKYTSRQMTEGDLPDLERRHERSNGHRCR